MELNLHAHDDQFRSFHFLFGNIFEEGTRIVDQRGVKMISIQWQGRPPQSLQLSLFPISVARNPNFEPPSSSISPNFGADWKLKESRKFLHNHSRRRNPFTQKFTRRTQSQ